MSDATDEPKQQQKAKDAPTPEWTSYDRAGALPERTAQPQGDPTQDLVYEALDKAPRSKAAPDAKKEEEKTDAKEAETTKEEKE